MKAIALVALGGATGAVLRYGASQASLRLFGEGWPIATLVVNVVGSFVLGWLLAHAGRAELAPELKLLLGTGLCGALTTFSTFSVESLALIERQDWRGLVLNVVLNVVLGLGAAWLGTRIRS